MPNWCMNSATITAPSEQAADRFEEYLKKSNGAEWMSYFRPLPESEKDNWYSWNLDNYGCKWDCDISDWSRDGLSFQINFDSPWGPPIAIYENLVQDGWEVSAGFFEPGMAFVGTFEDGIYESYDYSDLDSLDDIPEEVVESWGIREMLEEQESWNEDEEE